MAPLPSTIAPADPQPISAALKKHFDEELSQIPTGKSGRVSGAVTTTGAQVGIGFRHGGLTASGWAGREWSSGWTAGVSAGFVW